MLRGLKRREQDWRVGHGFVQSTNGGCCIFGGHSRAMPMIHCHSFACRIVELIHGSHVLVAKPRDEERLALVHSGRMSVLLESYSLQDQYNSDKSG
jgi:hypothetical protein